MNCEWVIAAADAEPAYGAAAAQVAFAEIDRLEGELSRYLDTSDIGRLNAAPADAQQVIGFDAIECLALAMRVWRNSGGAFDVTAPVSDPDARGFAGLVIDFQARIVTKRHAGVRVDLGGVGKGYALDQAVAALREWRLGAVVAHCGHSTALAFGDGSQAAYMATLRHPLDDSALAGVELREMALAGSAMVKKGAHILDPRGGARAAPALAAWAMAPSAALADALSTTCMLLRDDEIADMLRGTGEVRAFTLRDASGPLREIADGQIGERRITD